MHIELLSSPGCPNASAAREVLEWALNTLGIDTPIVERVGALPSPTVLINGTDVMRPGQPQPGQYCRLDLPSPERVLAALREAKPTGG